MRLSLEHITEIYKPTMQHYESQVIVCEHLGDKPRAQFYKGVVAGMNLIIRELARESESI